LQKGSVRILGIYDYLNEKAVEKGNRKKESETGKNRKRKSDG